VVASRTDRGQFVDYRLLGPLEVRRDGGDVALGGDRQRVLLAVLLLHANEVVSADVLIDGLWGETPPPSALNALHVKVSRLRRALGVNGDPQSDGVLATRGRGYVLRVDPGELDVDRFRGLLELGRQQLAAGDANQAADTLRSALAMWRGAALADFSYEPFAQPAIAELEELRLAALEERFEADLALGAHRELIGELTAAVGRNPLRDRLRAQLMLALYRCGRQAEALDAYQEFRRTLSQELGLDPGPGLQRLELAILARDASLDPPGIAAEPAGAHPTGASATPPSTSRPPGHRRWVRFAVGASVLLVVVLIAALIASSFGGKSPPMAVAVNSVGAISPETGGVRAVVPLGTSPQALAAGDGAVWVTNYEDGTVSRIDQSTRAIVDTVPVGSVPIGIAVGAGMVWVTNNTGQSVSEINPTVDRTVQTISVGSDPSGIAVGLGSVWVANTNGQTLTRIDANTGTVLGAPIPLGADATGVAAGLGAVWVSDTVDGRVLRVDPQSDQVSQSINVGHGPDAITVGDGSVWVANSLDGTVSRINPQTNAVTNVVPVGEGPAAIAVDRDGVWVANQFAGTVSRIDPATNTVARTITVGNRPAGIAVANGLVWVSAQAEATSHRGGTLTLLTTVPPRDLDPTAFPGLVSPLYWTNDGLVAYGRSGSGSGQPVPDLAVSLPSPTDGGKTYTFQLRRGIRYSNGAPVRPEDFRVALERDLLLGPNPQTSDYFANVIGGAACLAHPPHCDLSRGVVVDDQANTVTFHLVRPNPEFLDRLTLVDADAVPAGTPMHDIGLHPIPATGPYEVASISRAQVTLDRNPYFHEWSPAARPDGYPDKIVLRVVSSPSAEVTAVEQDRADVAMDTPPADRLHELQTRFANQLHTLPCLCDYSLILNTRVPPFNDIRVRRALNYAVDRAQVARLVGTGAHPTCQTLTPWFTGYQRYCPYTLDPTESGVWRAPDLATARRLITASHTRGNPVTIWLTAGTPPPVARYLVALLDQLGYRARLRDVSTEPYSQEYAQIANSRTRAQAFTFADGAVYPAASQLIETYFGCKYFIPDSPVNGNIAEFCDPRLDAQINNALAAEADGSPDAQLWAQADRTVVDDAPQLPLVIPGFVIFVSKRVGNFQVSAEQGVLPDQLWIR
jgi:YVTN family beta-propeller protein